MENYSLVVNIDGYTTGLELFLSCSFQTELLSHARSDSSKKHIIEIIVYNNHHHHHHHHQYYLVVHYLSSPLVIKRTKDTIEQNFKLRLVVSNRDILTATLRKITTRGYETSPPPLPFIFLPAFEQFNYSVHMMLQLHDTIVEEAIVLPTPMLCCDLSFNEMYTVGEVVGEGGFAMVRAGYRIEDHARVAIKVFDREHIDQKRKESIRMEYNILKSLNHDGVVRVLGLYEEPDHTYLVMECVEGGDLLDRIIAKDCYREGDARLLMLHLLETVKYLHDNDIVHGDLKPDNILLRSIQSDSSIKVADFGFACSTEIPFSFSGLRGTPAYIAPEILENGVLGLPIDMWACGVVLYVLLCGYVPFHHDDQEVRFNRIRHGKFIFHNEYWSHISNEAKNFIRQLLVVNPSTRLTVDQALQHPWLQGA